MKLGAREWAVLQSPIRTLAFYSGWVNGLEKRNDIIWPNFPQGHANCVLEVGGPKEKKPDQLERGIAVIQATEGSSLD